MAAKWAKVALGEVLSLLTDGSHFSPETVEKGLPYVTVRDVRDGRIDLHSCAKVSPESFRELEKNGCAPRSGDVLFSKDGTVGRVALVRVDSPFVVLSSLAILRPNQNFILPEFLAVALTGPEFQAEATGIKSGLAIKRVVLKVLRQIPLTVPPLDVQRRIVDVVASVDAYIESLQQQVDAARTARNAVLHDLMSTGGDDWTRTTLGGISELISRGRAPSYCEEDGVIVLNQKCIRNGRILLEFARRTDISKKAIPDWAYLKSGDVLINSTGTGTLGRASFVSHVNGLATFDSHVTLVRPRPELCLPAFVGINLNFREDEIESFAGGSTGQTELSRESVSSFPIVLPPMEEQERIVALATSMAEVSTASEKALSNAKALRSGLLADLLSGDHEIPESYDQFLGAA